MWGLPAGMAELLQRKYDIMQQQADTARVAATAGANLDNVKAGLMPAESAANVGLTKAQAGLASANIGLVGAETRKTNEEAAVVKPLANASIFQTRAQGSLINEQTVGERQLNRLSRSLASPTRGLPAADADFEKNLRSILRQGLGY